MRKLTNNIQSAQSQLGEKHRENTNTGSGSGSGQAKREQKKNLNSKIIRFVHTSLLSEHFYGSLDNGLTQVLTCT